METWEYEKLKHSLVEKGEAMKRQKGWMSIDQQFAVDHVWRLHKYEKRKFQQLWVKMLEESRTTVLKRSSLRAK